MSSPTRTALFASLLVIGAITLALTRKPTKPEPDRPKTPIPTLTRTKLPNRHATIAQLLSSKSGSQDRKSWAKSLSDDDLKRLTLEMIAAYQSDEDHSKTTPWLASLAMEWGRRDIDEFLEASENSVFQDTLHGPTISGFELLQSLKAAALVLEEA